MWLRIELTSVEGSTNLVIHGARVGMDGVLGRGTEQQMLDGLRAVGATYRSEARRFSRTEVAHGGNVVVHEPFDGFLDLGDGQTEHLALYLRLTGPLPEAPRHAILFQCVGQAFLPPEVTVTWGQLEGTPSGMRWRRLTQGGGQGEGYRLDRSGVLAFPYHEVVAHPANAGVWLRAVVRSEGPLPALPPISHVMMAAVEAVNLHRVEAEPHHGKGLPHQALELGAAPLFLHDEDGVLRFPEGFVALDVQVAEGDGATHTWRQAPENALLTATKADRSFTVDPVDGTLTFGDGLRGRVLPAGPENVRVTYHAVPGAAGNVGPGRICAAPSLPGTVSVTNPLPASGGRDAESIHEILRRAPAVLRHRDRAVTAEDFEALAVEASPDVARAACVPTHEDGTVHVVILPHHRPAGSGARPLPDPYLAGSLAEHVQRHLARRCLVNVQPMVELAAFVPVDVEVAVRLRGPGQAHAAEPEIEAWIRRFLDPWSGGIDGTGWPFGATLYPQDLARMAADVSAVRHVVGMRAFPIGALSDPPGWERGRGQSTLSLEGAELLSLRFVRVRVES